MITPACDLANRKVETVTYLPVISVAEWCALYPCAQEIRRELDDLLKRLGLSDGDSTVPDPKNALESLLGDKQKAKSAARALACLSYFHARDMTPSEPIDMGTIATALPKWSETVRRIIKNAHRTDMHFIPADGRDDGRSSIAAHSLVLFRYPMTAPIEIFDVANDISIADWATATTGLSARFPLAAAFASARPIKRGRLRKDFLTDLLTRFSALYLRIGSPDFDDLTIDSIASAIGGS